MSTCHVLIAIDASGSMNDLDSDVRGGFNQYLDVLAHRGESDSGGGPEYRITVALFNTTVWMLCQDVPLADAPRLTTKNYVPRGGTALLDAIGDLLQTQGVYGHVDDDEAGGDRVLVVVHTDGLENSSRRWRLGAVKLEVERRQETGKWGFVFLGAGIDAWEGEQLGFASGQTTKSSAGMRGTYSGLTSGTRSYAGGASAQSVTEEVVAASAQADAEAQEQGSGGGGESSR
jgi:hypothetical protein